MTDTDCLFCKIVAGEIPADVVASTDRALAFRDIDPKAPVHVLVVPREHHRDVAALAASDPQLLADVVALGQQVASDLDEGEFRLIFNTGARSGQSVFHTHGHVLAGTRLGWTPA
ncbi:histidine triad nucleotide-binding protein [Luteimicrobium xylanilyticum]|uniref:Putative HIT-like protein n=1 Tax=Luteimicrobium xylanilyticum TaxID=1133546 RepID=A0A5P9QBG6_9MICO|nr:histidine triad nucleotide-binding protein [Luteimicrobium xylanilyticum]QFU98689.1 putative HIT-like protein [Luteimicrobium xylanilyticum]